MDLKAESKLGNLIRKRRFDWPVQSGYSPWNFQRMIVTILLLRGFWNSMVGFNNDEVF